MASPRAALCIAFVAMGMAAIQGEVLCQCILQIFLSRAANKGNCRQREFGGILAWYTVFAVGMTMWMKCFMG